MVVEVVLIVISEEAVTNKIVVENVERKVMLEDVVVLLALEGGVNILQDIWHNH